MPSSLFTIWQAGVKAVQPAVCLPPWLATQHFKEAPWVLAVGKAASAMAQVTMAHIPTAGGLVITKHGHVTADFNALKNWCVVEAGHPVPDEASVNAAQLVQDFASARQADDEVLVMISGGASSLLADLPAGISLADLQTLSSLLLASGATIQEMNMVRKHCAALKGGHLSHYLSPAKIITVAISDVLGDDPAVIGSGLTVADAGTFQDSMSILERYQLWADCPVAIKHYLQQGADGLQAETIKQIPANSRYYCLATNQLALQAARTEAISLGCEATIRSGSLSGDIETVADAIAADIRTALKHRQPGKSQCLLWGGEPTLRLQSPGLGGRNQQLVLLVADRLKHMSAWCFLAAGTDGTDGPTDAAGGWVNHETISRATQLDLNISQHIQQCNAYPALKKLNQLFQPGPTQTNIMDLLIALV